MRPARAELPSAATSGFLVTMSIRFHDVFPPRSGRAHEASGPGALSFALALGARIGGTLLWVGPRHGAVPVNPAGAGAFFDPSRILLARAGDQTEVLAVGEEALRSGAVGLVVMEVTKPIGLTPGRRLQLAASAGKSTALCLIPEGMGSNAAETRWHCTPRFDPAEAALQRWALIKNKSGTIATWDIRWDAAARRVNVVSGADLRPDAGDAPG